MTRLPKSWPPMPLPIPPHPQPPPHAPLPVAIWEGTFVLFGVPLRCCVLDTGQRVIHAEDLELLFDAMGRGDITAIDQAEIERFAQWRATK